MNKIIINDQDKRDEKDKARNLIKAFEGRKFDTLTQDEKNTLLEILLILNGLANKAGKIKGSIEK